MTEFQMKMLPKNDILEIYTLPKFNSSPLKIGRAPKGNDRLPTTIFQGRDVKLRGGDRSESKFPLAKFGGKKLSSPERRD